MLILLQEENQFIILDTREEKDYDEYHIVEAINYPAPNIKRDRVFPLLLKFKNVPGKKIVIYNFDERTGIPVAKMFYDKGYDNIYLLSGGIEEFVQLHHELVEGDKVPPKKSKPWKK